MACKTAAPRFSHTPLSVILLPLSRCWSLNPQSSAYRLLRYCWNLKRPAIFSTPDAGRIFTDFSFQVERPSRIHLHYWIVSSFIRPLMQNVQTSLQLLSQPSVAALAARMCFQRHSVFPASREVGGIHDRWFNCCQHFHPDCAFSIFQLVRSSKCRFVSFLSYLRWSNSSCLIPILPKPEVAKLVLLPYSYVRPRTTSHLGRVTLRHPFPLCTLTNHRAVLLPPEMICRYEVLAP